MAYGTSLPSVSSPAVAAATYDAWFERPWGRYAFAIESKAVCDALGPIEGRTVLDAGCGTGRFSLVLSQAGARVVGVDHDMDALRIAARRAGAVACGDVAALPFADEMFDGCVAVTLCEFVDRPDRIVEELMRVTRSGGRVVIGSLNRRSPWGVAHRRHFRELPWRSAKFVDQRQLERCARRFGRTRRRGVLYAPGDLPLLGLWGPVAERAGRLADGIAAFQLLIVDKGTSATSRSRC